MHAFVLAGGFATRLWPLTEKRAKPLLPLAGKPIITHLVEKIPGDMPVTVSTNSSFGDAFEEWRKELGRENVRVLIEETHSDDHKLGALGAVAEWVNQEKISDDVLLLTGDNYLGFSMEKFLAAFKNNPLVAAYDIKDIAQASKFGTIIADEMMQVTAFEEKPKEPKSTLVSTGCSILPKPTLPVLVEHAKKHPDNVGGIFEEFLRRNIPVDCFTFTEAWLDIGSFHSYLDAHRLIVGGKTITQPGAKTVETHCEGSNVIGEGSTVERSTLTDCMVFRNCRIRDCILRNCIIDDDCTLEGIDLSDKMLRTGTILKRNTKE